MTSTFYLAATANLPSAVSCQFKELVDALSQKGFRLTESFPADFYISINHNPKMYRRFRKSGGLAKNSALVMLEPRAVYPSQYRKGVMDLYSIVITPGNPSSNSIPEKFIPWPYESIANPLNPTGADFDLKKQVQASMENLCFDYKKWSGRKYFLTMVNANKVSPVKEENYTLRRIYAKQLDKNFLSVFGGLWNSSMLSKVLHRLSVLLFAMRNRILPNLIHIYGNLHWKFPTSRGSVADKQKVLQASKYSLIIENDKSYVSEKLMDSLINGSIPVYFGPDLPHFIVPKNLYLILPQKPRDLLPMLLNLTEADIRNYLDNILAFVSSPNFYSRWEKKTVYSQIASEIALRFGETNE
jgi:hypothetical protein